MSGSFFWGGDSVLFYRLAINENGPRFIASQR